MIDVNFAKSENTEIDYLVEMDAIDRKKKTLIHQMKQAKANDQPVPETLAAQVADEMRKFNEMKRLYIEI